MHKIYNDRQIHCNFIYVLLLSYSQIVERWLNNLVCTITNYSLTFLNDAVYSIPNMILS